MLVLKVLWDQFVPSAVKLSVDSVLLCSRLNVDDDLSGVQLYPVEMVTVDESLK